MLFIFKKVSIVSLMLCCSASAFADNVAATQQVSTNMNVYLTVLKACTVSVSDMDFGQQYSNAGALKSEATASVTCTNGTSYKLSSADTNDFKLMNDQGNSIKYVLYTDSAESELLKDGIAGTGDGTNQQLKIYGKITADDLKLANAGVYKDTVSILVDY